MSKKCLIVAAIIVSLCAASQSSAQEKRSLSISQLLELVAQNNNDVAAARRDLEASRQGEQVAYNAKLPDINASLNLNFLGNITIMDRDFTDAKGYHMPHLGNSLELSIYQPIYAGGAINAGIDMAKTRTRLSETALSQTRQDASIRAVCCYLELCKASNLKAVYEENISLTRKLIADITARYKEGVALKNDITRYELRLSTLDYDLLTINNHIQVLNHDLCLLLGLSQGTEIETEMSEQLQSLPSTEGQPQWLERTMQNSTLLKTLDLQENLNSLEYRQLKAQRLPRIGLVAGDKFSGPIDFEIPVINSNYNFWFVGVNVSYNLSSLFKTPKSMAANRLEKEAIVSHRDAATDRLNSTINDTYTQYLQAFRMLQTEEKNVQLADENYNLVENRYNNQLALLTDMLDASTAKLDAEVRLVNARVNIIYYYYQLKYNSGTL